MLSIIWKEPWNGFKLWLHHNSLWTTLRYSSITCERRYGKLSFTFICKSKWLRINKTFLKKKYKVEGQLFFLSEIKNLLYSSISSDGLGLGQGCTYWPKNRKENPKTNTKNGQFIFDWDDIDTTHWLRKDKLFNNGIGTIGNLNVKRWHQKPISQHEKWKKMKYLWIKTYMYKAKLQCWVEIVSFQYVSTCTKSKAYKTM